MQIESKIIGIINDKLKNPIYETLRLLNITTIADRILLYFYPLQIVVFSRMLYLIKDKNLKNICFLGYILFSFLILFVFLNFGTYSEHWIPYNNLLLMENLK